MLSYPEYFGGKTYIWFYSKAVSATTRPVLLSTQEKQRITCQFCDPCQLCNLPQLTFFSYPMPLYAVFSWKLFSFNFLCGSKPHLLQKTSRLSDQIKMIEYVMYVGSEYVLGRGRLDHLSSSYGFIISEKLKMFNSFFLGPTDSLVCVYNSQRLQSLSQAEPGWGPISKYSGLLASLLSFICLQGFWCLGNVGLHA